MAVKKLYTEQKAEGIECLVSGVIRFLVFEALVFTYPILDTRYGSVLSVTVPVTISVLVLVLVLCLHVDIAIRSIKTVFQQCFCCFDNLLRPYRFKHNP